jgi:hypothetical protein
MNRYNKLKIHTLKVFAFAPGVWFRPKEVADRLDFVPRRAAWSYLKRLWRFGLLERRSFGQGILKYKISQRGLSRFGVASIGLGSC